MENKYTRRPTSVARVLNDDLISDVAACLLEAQERAGNEPQVGGKQRQPHEGRHQQLQQQVVEQRQHHRTTHA